MKCVHKSTEVKRRNVEQKKTENWWIKEMQKRDN